MIKVLVVDDIAETRDHLGKLLSFEREIDVAGMAASGEEAVRLKRRLSRAGQRAPTGAPRLAVDPFSGSSYTGEAGRGLPMAAGGRR